MKHTIITFFLFSFLMTGCQSVTKAKPLDNESLSAIKHNKNMIHYTKGDLKKIYDEIRKTSFPDTPKISKLIFKDMKVFGFASPFSLNQFININKINKYRWPKNAVIGLFAHELSHMVSYERR